MSMFKKMTALLLVAVTLLALLASCSEPEAPPSEQPPEDTTTAETTVQDGTTERPNYSKLEYTGKIIVKAEELGIRFSKYVISNPYVVDVDINGSSILLFCYVPGVATVEFTDDAGRSARIVVTVKEPSGDENENKKDRLSAEIITCEDYIGKAVVENKDMGLRVAEYTCSDPQMIDVEMTRTSLIIYCYKSGSTTFDLTDFFGRKAKLTVSAKEPEDGKASDSLVSVDITPCADKIIEVADFGAKGTGKVDDTSAFQAALDSASPGETVYVYPGRYNVSLLVMREGVTLKMYTEMTDAKAGYTEEIRKAVNAHEYAILSGTRILNNENGDRGAEGCSNFSIIGGVIDTNLVVRSTLIFGCAKNVRVENVIFKDMKGDHSIQFTGSTDSVVENCMFAGYLCGDAFTREVIQLEPSTPGATGGPLTFADGEYYCPKNITINNCYFGKSDEAGAPLMAIGHHGQVGDPNVTGLKITNNLFDEVLYAAIRYDNLVDVEITGNTFRSTSKYMNATQFSQATTPAFILLYVHNGNSTYTAADGKKVVKGYASEQAGLHNIKIENNEFNIGAGSDKRVMYYVSTAHTPGVSFRSCTRQEMYGLPTYFFSGYSVNRNYLENLSFSNNNITFEGQPTYIDYYIKLNRVYDLKMENNKVTLNNGTKFMSKAGNYEKGIEVYETDLSEAMSYVIKTMSTDRTVTLVFGDKTYKLTSRFLGDITLSKSKGGRIKAETDKDGNLTVTFVPAEGYTFGEITAPSLGELSSELNVLSSSTALEVTFVEDR